MEYLLFLIILVLLLRDRRRPDSQHQEYMRMEYERQIAFELVELQIDKFMMDLEARKAKE